MASVTVRNVPDEVHRALRVRAARHGRSTEAEIRDILETAVRSPDRVKLGSLLAEIGREAGMTDTDCAFVRPDQGSGTGRADKLRMILLDTNVISEPLEPAASPAVLAWIDAQAIETLYISTITLAEIRFGIAALPDGKRRTILHQRLEERFLPLFTDRILPFGVEATIAYAALRTRARTAGRAIGVADGYIAAIASTHGFIVATRDTAPFLAAGLVVINPWGAAG